MKITVTTDAKGTTAVAADETPEVLQVLSSPKRPERKAA